MGPIYVVGMYERKKRTSDVADVTGHTCRDTALSRQFNRMNCLTVKLYALMFLSLGVRSHIKAVVS